MLTAHDAVDLCGLLEQHHIRYLVVGGWGVDALLGHETRPHKDLDLLVLLDDLPQLLRLFNEHGFTQQWVWQENRWLVGDGELSPTAFVVADGQGRELDIHVIDLGPDGAIVQLYDAPWPFTASLTAITSQGSIDGVAIPCASKEAQLAMHTGYSLPAERQQDIEHLRRG